MSLNISEIKIGDFLRIAYAHNSMGSGYVTVRSVNIDSITVESEIGENCFSDNGENWFNDTYFFRNGEWYGPFQNSDRKYVVNRLQGPMLDSYSNSVNKRNRLRMILAKMPDPILASDPFVKDCKGIMESVIRRANTSRLAPFERNALSHAYGTDIFTRLNDIFTNT